MSLSTLNLYTNDIHRGLGRDKGRLPGLADAQAGAFNCVVVEVGHWINLDFGSAFDHVNGVQIRVTTHQDICHARAFAAWTAPRASAASRLADGVPRLARPFTRFPASQSRPVTSLNS